MAKKYPMERMKPKPSTTDPAPRLLSHGGHMSTTEYNLYKIADAANGMTSIRDDVDDTTLPGPRSVPGQPVRSDEYQEAAADRGSDQVQLKINSNPRDNLYPRYISPLGSIDRYTGESV